MKMYDQKISQKEKEQIIEWRQENENKNERDKDLIKEL